MQNNNPMVPLTKDEMTFFGNLLGSGNVNEKLEQAIKDFGVSSTKKVNELIESIDKNTVSNDNIAQAIKDCFGTFRKMYFATNKSAVKPAINPILYSSISKEKQIAWKKDAIDRISSVVGKRENHEKAYSIIYSGIKEKGYDLEKLLREYLSSNPDATIIDMCSASDTLRMAFECQINKLIFDHNLRCRQHIKSEKKVTYKEANSCPKEIRLIIASLSPSGKTSGLLYNKTLREIERRSGVDIEKLIKKTKKKYNINKCSVWFAVSKDPDLMSILNTIAAEKAGR